MPDLANERLSRLFYPRSASGGPAAIGDVWTFDTGPNGAQWKTPLSAGVTLPLSQANGGTGASSLPMTAGPDAAVGTLLQTNSAAVSPTTDITGTLGYWGQGWVISQAVGSPGAGYEMDRVNGSLASPTPLLANDNIGGIYFNGCAVAGSVGSAARGIVSCFAAENWSATVQGTRIELAVTLPGTLTGSMALGISNGVVVGAPTGSYKGAGTLNATAVYANNVLLTSDMRLKEDIGRVPEGCLGLVSAIAPKTFRHKGSESTNWGFIAQEVNAVMTVAKHYDFGGHVEDGEGNQYLNTQDLVAVLWAAVRELREEVRELKGEK